jgi:hypothetical protein
MKHELGTVIARRDYFSAREESAIPVVRLEIGMPAKSPHAEDEYMCSFRLKVPGSERTETVYGIDELQALQLALGDAEAKLRALSSSADMHLHWAGGEDGDLGIRIPAFSN